MADIVHLHEDPHERARKLLPWYANGTLEPGEAALVEEHLAACAECREALEMDRALGKQGADSQLDVEQGWAAMRDRLTATRDRPAAPVRLLRRSIPIGWAIAAQAIAATLILALALPSHPPTGNPAYHALGAVPTVAAGNIIIQFRPDTTERDMRSALQRAEARLVGGPTAGGAYLLAVPAARRPDALRQLRATSGIVLAEPIDRGDGS
ncbi:hypothetical protein GCM10009087_39760 [Sphingomonas oligophenolica]|uniref:Zf-HC2 domain-containing protein n=1 Tax=Sphingomonas oligophenolica TaxID=301154 RepID=A0ABU9Y281_9SPHN